MQSKNTRRTLSSVGIAGLTAGAFVFTGLVAAPAASAVTAFGQYVVINEVESNAKDALGNDLPDFVELFNTSNSAITFSNVAIADNNDTHVAKISGTIPANGYFVVETDDPLLAGNFGLGNADSIRLYDENEDPSTPGVQTIDSYSWTQHAATSYGRFPDGNGAKNPAAGSTAFRTLNAVSKGATNVWTNPGGNPSPAPFAGVVINEVRSQGTDFVELYNTTEEEVDISGALLTDDNNGHVYQIPANTILADATASTGVHYVSFNVDDPANPRGGFGLGANDEARLFAPGTSDIATATPIDRVKWSTHAPTGKSYGLDRSSATVKGNLRTTAVASPGAVNTFGTLVPKFNNTQVIINEVESNPATSPVPAVAGDWVELKNKTNAALDIEGLVITDADPLHTFTVNAGVSIPANGYLAIRVDDPGSLVGAGDFGLGNVDAARLFNPGDNTVTATPIDATSWTAHAANTWGRLPDTTGAFGNTSQPTPNAANL